MREASEETMERIRFTDVLKALATVLTVAFLLFLFAYLLVGFFRAS